MKTYKPCSWTRGRRAASSLTTRCAQAQRHQNVARRCGGHHHHHHHLVVCSSSSHSSSSSSSSSHPSSSIRLIGSPYTSPGGRLPPPAPAAAAAASAAAMTTTAWPPAGGDWWREASPAAVDALLLAKGGARCAAAMQAATAAAAAADADEAAAARDVVRAMRALAQLARRTGEEAAVDNLLAARPHLLALRVDAWLAFLSAYGVRDADVVKLLLTSPELFERADVHSAGCVMLAFKQLGWTDQSIARRLVPLYPRLLAGSVDRDVAPVVAALADAGCTGKHLRLVAWEVPRIFSRHTFRRYLRQFQALGVYGLGGSSSGGGDDGDGGAPQQPRRRASERAVAATMLLHPFG